MTAPVKRYNMDVGKFGNVDAYESEHGRWVKRDDYDRLEQECERLRDESHRNRVDLVAAVERCDTLRAQVEAMRAALEEVRTMFPFKLEKQAFVVNGGAPLRADGDEEFYSASKVNDLLGDIRCKLEAALQDKPDHIPDTTKMVSADT